LPETQTACYAWAFIPNHAHFLFRGGIAGISTLMRRLFTGYAVYFNRMHKRHGQLFQNRYKSMIYQEDIYFRELVRYIHLNPMRAKIVSGIKELNRYPYSGHSVIMGKQKHEWQDIETKEIYSKGQRKVQVEARDMLCYWAVRELGISCTDLAKHLEISQPEVGYAVNRGEKIAKEHNYHLL